MTFKVLYLLVLLRLFSTASVLLAQSTTGSIQGTVTDEQKALIPGAMITVRNLETNATRSTTSDEGGRFRMITASSTSI